MRANGEAFQALLLAVRTWHEIAFRAGREMDDEPDPPRRRNPSEDRNQLSVFRITALRIVHYPERCDDPTGQTRSDEENLEYATRAPNSKDPGCGRRRGRGVHGTRGNVGRGRHPLREESCGREKEGRSGEQSLHDWKCFRAWCALLSTQLRPSGKSRLYARPPRPFATAAAMGNCFSRESFTDWARPESFSAASPDGQSGRRAEPASPARRQGCDSATGGAPSPS